MKIQERIVSIEKEIRETPYHKGTERHIGKLKARLAKLRCALDEGKLKGKGGGTNYTVRKTGDATVVLVGPPSVGKSTLLNVLTSARSKVAEYEFTTLKVIPGIMNYNGAKIQILDVPGLVTGAARGVGRGKEVLSVARIADLILLMTDAGRVSRFEKMQKELYGAGVRLNQKPPRVTISRKSRGGFVLNSPPLSHLSKVMAKEIAREFGLVNAEVTIEEDITIDRLIDALAGNRVYVPGVKVVNKVDLALTQGDLRDLTSGDLLHLPAGETGETPNVLAPGVIKISARKERGLDKLRDKMWKKLGLMRIYLRNKEGEVDYDEPVIVKDGVAVREAAEKISTELAEETSGAKIWGARAAFHGQKVGLGYRLSDEMIVRFF